MMTFLSVYAGKTDETQGGYGYDHGYWPKEAMIDYLRIYKKDEAPKPNSVVLNKGLNTAWDYFPVKDTEGKYRLTAQVLDQYDRPYALKQGESLKWRFSSDIGGISPAKYYAPRTAGAFALSPTPEWWKDDGSINAQALGDVTLTEDGLLTIPANTSLERDMFITAYVDGVDTSADPNFALRKVRETKHVKLSDAASEPSRIVFENAESSVAPGANLRLKAKVYDQYMQEMPGEAVSFSLAEDIGENAAETTAAGIKLWGRTLIAAYNAEPGTQLIVRAQAGGLYQSLPLVVGFTPTMPAIPAMPAQPAMPAMPTMPRR
jgi:hypothetical protein